LKIQADIGRRRFNSMLLHHIPRVQILRR
jgi:hypothetical protein